MFSFLCSLFSGSASERGQAMTEYILIIAIIAVALIVALVAFRNQLNDLFTYVINRISGRDAELHEQDAPNVDDPWSDDDDVGD